VERHLELSPGFLLDRHLGIRVYRAGLAAGKIHGDSMIYRDVLDGDIAIFQRYDFNYLQNGAIVVIEKRGEEEGFGAWALKKLVIERPRSSRRNEYEDEIDWDDPVFVLHSSNPRVSPSWWIHTVNIVFMVFFCGPYVATMPRLWILRSFDTWRPVKSNLPKARLLADLDSWWGSIQTRTPSAGSTLMKSLSHLKCLPEGVGRPPGKV
jgi:hypothetical protein